MRSILECVEQFGHVLFWQPQSGHGDIHRVCSW
jgi:hypothetical protein